MSFFLVQSLEFLSSSSEIVSLMSVSSTIGLIVLYAENIVHQMGRQEESQFSLISRFAFRSLGYYCKRSVRLLRYQLFSLNSRSFPNNWRWLFHWRAFVSLQLSTCIMEASDKCSQTNGATEAAFTWSRHKKIWKHTRIKMKLSTFAISSLFVTLLFGQGQVVVAAKRNSKGVRGRNMVRWAGD